MKLMITIQMFLVCLYAGTVAGQTDTHANVTDEKDQEQPMEEITVIGQRSLLTLRIQIDKAEDRIFDIFNKLNTDDLYDIHCSREAPTGSHIRHKRCSPVYFDRTEADATHMALTGGGDGSAYMMARLAHYNPIMGEKWKQLVKDNPELLQAVVKHYELSEELKRERRAYFGWYKIIFSSGNGSTTRTWPHTQ